jgi:ketosteroid isomerase-like protein
MITRDQYADYIAAFNRDDFDGFAKFYADDVVLELPARTLRGRDAILAFYREVKKRMRETLKIGQLVIDEEGLAVEADTEFYCKEDWPDFIVKPMKKGESIRSVSFILYKIRDGKFAHIRSARFKSF